MPTWIRVKDNVTGDEYDVEKTALRSGMTPIDGYPENAGPAARARPAKPMVAKDGQPPAPANTPPAEDGGNQTAPLTGAKVSGTQKSTSTPAEPADTDKETR